MRALTFYAWAGRLVLFVALVAAVFAIAGVVTVQTTAASASALCAAAFFVPGIVFANQARRLRLRELALRHVATFVEERGVVPLDDVAAELAAPKDDAEKILRRAVREGYARGELDGRGRFVASTAKRCPRCNNPLPSVEGLRTCASCAAELED